MRNMATLPALPAAFRINHDGRVVSALNGFNTAPSIMSFKKMQWVIPASHSLGHFALCLLDEV
jgi:hypothetical protein